MDPKLLEQLSIEATTAKVGFGSDEYFAARFAGGDRRYAMWAVFALKSLLENIPLSVSDSGVARLKLAWWSKQSDADLAHPLFRIAEALSVDCALLNSAIQSMSSSLEQHYVQQPFASSAEREQWFVNCYLGFYKLLAFEASDDSAKALCGPLESARSLLRFKEELDLQILRLSVDVLHRGSIEIASLFSDPDRELIRKLVHSELVAAETTLGAAIEDFQSSPNPALTYAMLTKKQLEETIRDGGDLLSRKVELTPLRKLWTAWRNR